MQRVLITGAAGMLGAQVAQTMLNQNNFEVYGTGRAEIHTNYTYIKADLLNNNELNNLLAYANPDIIVHCAANVNLSDCELHKTDAYKINVEVSKQLASFKTNTCRFIYISTDSVFDGLKENYSETDVPNPLNYYALSKLEGEKAVLNINRNALILRTNIYGFNRNKKGNSLFEWIYKNLKESDSISGFTDIRFNPLYVGQLAEIISKLIHKKLTGILHAGCEEKVSKYQFAILVAEVFDFDKSLIKADVSDVMPSIIKRPKNTTLHTAVLRNYIEKKYTITDGINQLTKDFLQQKICND